MKKIVSGSLLFLLVLPFVSEARWDVDRDDLDDDIVEDLKVPRNLSFSPIYQVAFSLTSGEGAGASADPSTRFLEKGDFVRFQNATLGYNVPLSEDSVFKVLRLSVTGQNLFLITDYSGIDPEVTVNTGDLGSGVPSRGIDWSAFPNPRTFTFGINASF